MQLKQMNKIKKCLFVFAVILLALLIIPHLSVISVDNIVGLSEISLLVTVIGFIVLYIIKGLAMVVPSSLLYIAAALVFPPLLGILITYVGLTVSLSIGYVLGNRLGEEKVTKMLAKHEKIAGFLDGKKKNLTSLCFITRLLHMPFGLVSLFLGALNMPFLKYIIASLLGVSPIMIPVMFTGVIFQF